VKNRVSNQSNRKIISKSEKKLTTHKNFCFRGLKICRFVLKLIDLSEVIRKWKEQKKLSENIYIVNYLMCLLTVFRSLKKFFSKKNGKHIKTLIKRIFYKN
jgi:hypothetical protein